MTGSSSWSSSRKSSNAPWRAAKNPASAAQSFAIKLTGSIRAEASGTWFAARYRWRAYRYSQVSVISHRGIACSASRSSLPDVLSWMSVLNLGALVIENAAPRNLGKSAELIDYRLWTCAHLLANRAAPVRLFSTGCAKLAHIRALRFDGCESIASLQKAVGAMLIADDVADSIGESLQLAPKVGRVAALDASDMDMHVAAGRFAEPARGDRRLDSFAERRRQDHLARMQDCERGAAAQHHPACGRRNNSAAFETRQTRGCVQFRYRHKLLNRDRVGRHRSREDSDCGGVGRQCGSLRRRRGFAHGRGGGI